LGLADGDIDRALAQASASRQIAVRAPRGGIVTHRNVSVGTYATPDMTLFTITDLSTVWVLAAVSVNDAATLPPGTEAHFLSRGGGRTPMRAALTEPLVSSETRTARVRFVAENSTNALLPGDIGDVLISVAAQESIVVPRDSVIDVGSVSYVFIEGARGVFAPRIVEVGALLGEERAILRGLEEGETIVSRGAFLLDSESRLRAAVAPTTSGDGSVPVKAPHSHGAP
jgi:Cu(I)/Ag(I) efflux system membrane fusion protein